MWVKFIALRGKFVIVFDGDWRPCLRNLPL